MLSRRGCGALAALVVAVIAAAAWLLGGWYSSGPLRKDTNFTVANGSTLSQVAQGLQRKGVISSADGFTLRTRFFGGGRTIKAGEFAIPAHASAARTLAILTSDDMVRRYVTIPEGMPSIMVYDRLMANTALTGKIAVPAEGSVLPDTYQIEKGESRQALLSQMQAAMKRTLARLWAQRAPNLVIKTPEQAIILASIVEKETGKPTERAMVAGLYSNRLRAGMLLQADPTIIYPITRGKPLGRRIRESEIQAVNDYNTYTRKGLPLHPITNPGRASIKAVLHPANTKALYMVADGTGGHVFADTLAEHNRNVAKWFAIRRARGDL